MNPFNYSIDDELLRYEEAANIKASNVPDTPNTADVVRYNAALGVEEVYTTNPSGGHVKIAERSIDEIAKLKRYDAALREQNVKPSIEDYYAWGADDDMIAEAGLSPQAPMGGRTEPLTEFEQLYVERQGLPTIQPSKPTMRQAITDLTYRNSEGDLRKVFTALGIDEFTARQIAEGIWGNPESTRGDLGMGAADFTPAGLFFGAQEGMQTYQRGMNAGDYLTAGAGALEAGLSFLEALPMTAVGAKALKKNIPAFRQALIDLGQGAEARIAERGDTTLFSNPVEPVVDQALAMAGRATRVEKPTETKPGIIAFHGSGADFDEFSLDMIGTGEGSQAYGYGLYFTDTKSIAEFYKDAVREESNIIHLDGKPIDSVYSSDNEEKFSEYITENFEPDQFNDAYMVLDNLGQGISSVEDADSMAASSLTRPQMQTYNKIRNDLEVPELPEGKMYEVMINIQPDDLLDYDKPLNSQSKEIQSAALKAAKSAGAYKGTDKKTLELSGGALLADMVNNIVIKQNLQGMTSEAEKIAAQELFNQGIPGLKYFDNASRNTADGTSLGVVETEKGFVGRVESTVPSMFGPTDPQRVLTRSAPYKTKEEAEGWIEEAIGRNTRNYVIFDDKLINIMKKYGIVGPVAVSAMASQEQEET